MPFGTHRLAIGIVIELDEFQSPPNEHRVERGENKSNRNPKTLRSCFRRAERRFLTSQILPPKRSSRRPRQELADYLLTPCVQPSLRRLSSTYSQSSAKFNCRFASRPICHVRAGSALPSIEDLDERSRGNATSSPAAATSTRMLEIITARKTLSISANAGCLWSFQFWQDRRATRAHRKNPRLER